MTDGRIGRLVWCEAVLGRGSSSLTSYTIGNAGTGNWSWSALAFSGLVGGGAAMLGGLGARMVALGEGMDAAATSAVNEAFGQGIAAWLRAEVSTLPTFLTAALLQVTGTAGTWISNLISGACLATQEC